MRYWTFCILALLPVSPACAQDSSRLIEGVTFAGSNRIYVPVREAGEALGWPVSWEGGTVFLRGEELDKQGARKLLSGSRLIYVRDLERVGASVQWDPDRKTAIVTSGDGAFQTRDGDKRTIVDRENQELRAYQGDRLVLKTDISTGAMGRRTPAGTYRAGPYKARMHYSSLYNNAPMPYSVQLAGDIFIHGFHSVPEVPASHGCIRVPISGSNPARWFYRWVDVGTPVTVKGRWEG